MERNTRTALRIHTVRHRALFICLARILTKLLRKQLRVHRLPCHWLFAFIASRAADFRDV